MKFPDAIFSAAIDRALGWTVLHSVWQITLLALLAGILLFVFREKAANLRYRVANIALLAVLLSAAATFLWEIKSNEQEWRTVKSAWQDLQNSQAAPDSIVVAHSKAALPADMKRSPRVHLEKDFMDYFDEHLPLIVLIWLMGLTLFLFRLMSGISYTYYLRQRMNFPTDPYWSDMLQELCQKAGLQKSIDLLESALVRSPLTIGYLKPIILFPIGIINRLSEQEVEAILAHELAHILRHDYLFNILQSLVEALFYYHPAVWWLSAQVRNERESACDDMAIALMGNKLNYAKALVTMQEMAFFPLSPALAFAGQGKKQFLTRMQRLFSQTTFKINVMEKWIATVLVACSIVALAIGQRVAPNLFNTYTSNEQSGEGDPKKGLWQAEFFKDSLCLNLSGGNRNNHWSHGSCYLQKEFANLKVAAGETTFSLTRPAGTIVFNGKIEQEDGYGRYEFSPNEAYKKELEAQGINMTDDFLLFHLFFAGFPSNYIASLKKEGFKDIDEDRLTQLAVFNLDLPQVKEYVSLNQKLGGEKISLDKLVELKVANVTPEQVELYAKSGYANLNLDDISQFSMQNIDPAFIEAMNAQGFGKLSSEDIMTAKIHGITPEFIADCKKSGLGDLPFEDITTMKIHGITPEFIANCKKSGFGDLSFEDIVAIKIHDISPDFIAQCRNMGLGNVSFEDIMAMRIHNITPEFVAACKKTAQRDVSFEDVISMRIHNISPEFVAEAKSMNLGDLSVDDLMTMRIHSITPDFAKTFRDMGFKSLTLDDLVSAKIHDVTPEFIKKAEQKGYKFPSLEEYADLKLREALRGRRSE